jgi:hypothetical protein
MDDKFSDTAFDILDAYLKEGRNKEERPWGNNTRVRQAFDHIIVRLHNTDIANLSVDGSITLNTDGWQTVTTKDRLNKVLTLGNCGHWRLWSEKGIWMLYYFSPDKGNADPIPSYAFTDGVTVWPDGRIEGQAPEPPTKQRKAAKSYVNKLVAALFDGSLPAPDDGDCWFCRGIFGESGEHDDDHIKSHIEEGYLVPSLLANVICDETSKLGSWPRQYCYGLLMKTAVVTPTKRGVITDVSARQLKRATWVYIATRIGIPT